MITYKLLDEAAVAAALMFKDTGLSVQELEAVAAAVQAALNDHFKWKVTGD